MAYQDIDLSFGRNIYGDIAILVDENAVKNSLYNNLLIGSDERPLDDRIMGTISDFLFQPNDFLTRNNIKDAILTAAIRDDRIVSVQNTSIKFDEDAYTYTASLTLLIKTTDPNETLKPIDITLLLKKN